MCRLFATTRKKLPILFIVLTIAAGVAWWQRTPLLSWYYVRELSQATEKERADWADRVAGLGGDAVPGLIKLLSQNDALVCTNSEAGLSALARQWGPASALTVALAQQLTAAFDAFSTPGREAVVEWHLAVLSALDGNKENTLAVRAAAVKLLSLAAQRQEKGMRVRTLALAEMVLGSGGNVPIDLCRDLATEGMASQDAEIRGRAIRLVMHAPLHSEQALLVQVLPFLKDTAPAVRRSAVLAVGLAEETISIQEMLTLLHDPDAEVRRLCEGALRGRGLQDDHVKLAIKISDPLPRERVNVVNLLPEIEDLDSQQWLLHLSQDSSPAVRAAAIRFAAEDPAAAEFQERMLQMARDDPSPTVRQLATFYLKVYRR